MSSPSAVRAPEKERSNLLDAHLESLQRADSVEQVTDVIRDAVSRTPGVGRGTIFLTEPKSEPTPVAQIEGPRKELVAPALELVGLARRAYRERTNVTQSGATSGSVWAVPLTSAREIHGVVAATGDMGELTRFLAHAGHALARERSRAFERERWADTERRTSNLEQAIEVLDSVAADDGDGLAERKIVTGVAGVPGVGGVTLRALRVQDLTYVEVAATRDAPEPPPEARRVDGMLDWVEGLPSWRGFRWISGPPIDRPRPGTGDTLLLTLNGSERPDPIGYLLIGLERSLEDAIATDDLQRWASLGRIALSNQRDRELAGRRYEEIQNEKDHLSELHRLKSQFIAAVSHELRTPLTSICAYAETLRSPAVREDEETRDRFLRVIQDESRRLTRIVDDILDLATMDSGHVRLSCRPDDLAALVRDAFDVIHPIAREKDIRIVEPDTEEARVHADPDLLKQLIVNLLENAVKFSPRGAEVRVSIELDASTVRLVVEDDGPGIPTEELDAIFERFHQIDGSNAREHGGSGLGLAICRSIATWHDGRIWAESGEGEGARFIVSLPRGRAIGREKTDPPTVVKRRRPRDHRLPELMTEMIAEVMGAETVSLMLLDPAGNELYIQAALGLPDETIRDVRVAVGERISGVAAETGKTVFIPDLNADPRFVPTGRENQYRTPSLLSVPIRLQDTTIGVINVTNKSTAEPFSDHDRRLLEILTERVATVLRKLREYGSTRERVECIEEAIRGVIDVRRHYFPRGEDSSDLVLGICQELGLDQEEAVQIHYASVLHDVGMTRLPEGVYKKPADLSERDREMVHRHPEEAARVLRSLEYMPDVFDIIVAHHEEPDGSGYPKGLTAPVIPMGAKILAVVDAYHALRSERPYRDPVSREEAIEELRRNSGKQFEPEIVESLVRVLEKTATRGRR
jgi:signal transduction histidine kinase/putative methionine-R-sulfoxide reductase with GAF domain